MDYLLLVKLILKLIVNLLCAFAWPFYILPVICFSCVCLHLIKIVSIDSISNSIDNVLLNHPTANIFVFGDFNVHNRDWLKFSTNTDAPGNYVFDFAVSHALTQVVDFPARIPDRNDQSPKLLDLFLTSDPENCTPSVLAPLGNSDHVVVSVSIKLPNSSKKESPTHRTSYNY